MSDEPTQTSEVEPIQAQVLEMPAPPHEIAFIIDGVVEDVIWVPDRFASILLSNPTIKYSTGVQAQPGQTTYDEATNTFTNPGRAPVMAEEFTLKGQ